MFCCWLRVSDEALVVRLLGTDGDEVRVLGQPGHRVQEEVLVALEAQQRVGREVAVAEDGHRGPLSWEPPRPGEGEAVGAADGDGERGRAGRRPRVTVATAPRLMGPFLSLPSSNCTGAFRVRSVSAQDSRARSSRGPAAKTPSMVPVFACTLRAGGRRS